MISLDEARALLLADVRPVESEVLPISKCGGRTLASDMIATRDQPPGLVSAMDGYAVAAADARQGAILRVIGEAPAGAPFAGAVEPGTAVRIATGGVVPPGAERIVVQEIVEQEEGSLVRISGEPGAASFVRAAGCDFAAGETLAGAGDLLTAARIGLAAAANLAELDVRRRPRVILLPSGDELSEPGSALAAGGIVNSASYALAELVANWGGDPARHPILPDDHDSCAGALAASDLDAEIIIPLGGASVGDRDVLKPLILAMGAEPVFERISVQPGKPCWHARFGDWGLGTGDWRAAGGTDASSAISSQSPVPSPKSRPPGRRLVLGLPGNPASAFVCAHLLLRPLLHALLGRSETERPLFAALTHDLPAGGTREVWWRAHLSADGEGRLLVEPDFRLDSSLQAPLAAANALLRRMPNAPAAAAGVLVEVMLIGR